MAIVGTHGEKMLAGLSGKGNRGNVHLVMLVLGVRQSSYWFDVLPGSGVERVLGVCNRRTGVFSVEAEHNWLGAWSLSAGSVLFASFEMCHDSLRSVHFEAIALLIPGERFAGAVRGGIRGQHLDLI